jgi:hypothetical protein
MSPLDVTSYPLGRIRGVALVLEQTKLAPFIERVTFAHPV